MIKIKNDVKAFKDPEVGDVIVFQRRFTGIVYTGLIIESCRVVILHHEPWEDPSETILAVGTLTTIGETWNFHSAVRHKICSNIEITLS